MAYDRALISRILRQLEEQRQQHEAEAEERRYRLTHTIPRLGEIDRELRATAAKAMRIAFESNNTDSAIAALRDRNLALQDEKRRILLENGVPDSAILREDEATYTYQNAIFSRRRTDSEALCIRRAIICCMPVHARRARMYYETLFPEAELLVCPVGDTAVNRTNWMREPEGIDAVLGEMERCGSQFHDILRELMLPDC